MSPVLYESMYLHCVYVCLSSKVMSHPVVTLRSRESVGRIVDILQHENHHGFPVVDNDFDPTEVIAICCMQEM